MIEDPDACQVVDYEARGMAQQALDKIEGHEKLCTERWDNVKNVLKGINNRLWWIIATVVAGQGAIILFLLNSGN